MSRDQRPWLLVALVAVVLSGCSAANTEGSPSPLLPSTLGTPMTLSVKNETTIPVTLLVNGKVIETVPPRTTQDPIDAALPGLPWNVETHSPSGRVLSSMTVKAGDLWQTTVPNGGREVRGDFVRADLACGRLDVWSAPPQGGPMGPAFSPGPSGDCA